MNTGIINLWDGIFRDMYYPTLSKIISSVYLRYRLSSPLCCLNVIEMMLKSGELKIVFSENNFYDDCNDTPYSILQDYLKDGLIDHCNHTTCSKDQEFLTSSMVFHVRRNLNYKQWTQNDEVSKNTVNRWYAEILGYIALDILIPNRNQHSPVMLEIEKLAVRDFADIFLSFAVSE